MIPFNAPALILKEFDYIREAVELGQLSGEGNFARKCAQLLASILGADSTVMLTPSCTAALEISALLLDLNTADEVIMPSFTFVSTANAFALRGAKPIFADIDPQTLNIRPDEIERLITPKTKAVVVVHYAGRACDMDSIDAIVRRHKVPLIEDAAHALGSQYHGKQLGTFGALSTFSFHETKNVTCGEGGALVINDKSLVDRAFILRDKGTNRRQFFRGDAPFYSWVDIGSSYVISDVLAAFLYAQLEELRPINGRRKSIVERYSEGLSDLLVKGHIWYPYHADGAPEIEANGHMFFLLAKSSDERERLRKHLLSNNVGAVSHYQPLHQSPHAVKSWGAPRSLPVTEDIAGRLLRLPLFYGLTDRNVDYIVGSVRAFYSQT